ncbi:MAG: tetratricopeptide repeat protein [Lachnospiraceae bacterium]
MEKQMIFHVLGIDETRDESLIKKAYRELLKEFHPEEDPEGFKRLREAYEAAIELSRRQDEEQEEEKEKTEVDLWIDRVDNLYQDILNRASVEKWDQILRDPVCDALDTSLEAREKMLVYLMDHTYLPQDIWKVLDHRLQILRDLEALKQQFPVNFLEFIKHNVENQEFLDYGLFQVLDPETLDADAYIRHYLDAKRLLDQGEPGESCSRDLDDLKAFGLYHPYEDVERIRLVQYQSRQETDEEEGRRLMEKSEAMGHQLEACCPNDVYLLIFLAAAKWNLEKRDEANRIWTRILEINPNHYTAKMGIIQYLMEEKEFTKAKELLMDLLEVDGQNERLLGYMDQINEWMIQDYRAKAEDENSGEEERLENRLELCWCLFQSGDPEEAAAILEQMEPTQKLSYSYYNLYGRLLYKMENYEKALPYLQHWLELIHETVDDGSKENQKRISREPRAYHIIGGCLYQLGRQEEAEEAVRKAAECAANEDDQLSCLQYLSYIMFMAKKYERSIDVSDEILEMNSGYYPAYLQRQESCFELKKGQQVIDDYYNAIEIYGGYYKPYLLAAKVFFFVDQFEDAQKVFERARENQVEFSDEMKNYEVKVLRNLAASTDEREELIQKCQKIIDELNPEATDLEDRSELEFEIAVLYWDLNELDEALRHLRTAMEQNPERMQYRMVCGHIYLDKKEYQKAIQEYGKAREEYEDSPSLYYNLGVCYEKLKQTNQAMENFRKVLELDDKYRDTNEKLGDFYWDEYETTFREADLEKALEYMTKQLEARENCYYLIERGRVYMHASRFEEAIADFEKALEYVPDDWAAYNNMGYCYKVLRQYEKSIEMYEKSIEVLKEEKNLLPYSNMADIYEILGDFEKSVWCYEKDLEWFPNRMSFWEEIGKLYSYMGNTKKALEAFGKNPDDEDYFNNVGDMWSRQGNEKKAFESYLKAFRKKGIRDLHTWEMMGDYFRDNLGQCQKAIFCYKKALSLADNDRTRYLLEKDLTFAYFQLGKKDKAKQHAQKAIEYFKKSGQGELEDYLNFKAYGPARKGIFGRLYLAMGETEKGLKLLEEMDQGYLCKSCRAKGCYDKYYFLGLYYRMEKRYDEALEAFEKGLALRPHSIELKRCVEEMRKIRR